MTTCLVTATAASRALLDADQISADQFLIEAINRSSANGRNITLVDDPVEADLILFAESHRNDDAIRHVLRHPIYRDYRKKCVVHCGMDFPTPLVPGLYPSIGNRWARAVFCVGSPYLASLNPYVGRVLPQEIEVAHLASFMGACARKKVRQKLLRAAGRGHWTDVVVRDTGPAFVGSISSGDKEAHLSLKRQFALDLLRSRFALCPGGSGASSFRIFEAMQSGRSPVVIADDWTPPPGPDWDSFAIRVPESRIHQIPQILAERSSLWREMGSVAREQWEKYCGPTTLGPEIIDRAIQTLSRANAHPYQRAFNAWLYVNGPRRVDMFRDKLVHRAKRIFARFTEWR